MSATTLDSSSVKQTDAVELISSHPRRHHLTEHHNDHHHQQQQQQQRCASLSRLLQAVHLITVRPDSSQLHNLLSLCLDSGGSAQTRNQPCDDGGDRFSQIVDS